MNASEFEDAIYNLSDEALNKYIAYRKGWMVKPDPDRRGWTALFGPDGLIVTYCNFIAGDSLDNNLWSEDYVPQWVSDMNESVRLLPEMDGELCWYKWKDIKQWWVGYFIERAKRGDRYRHHKCDGGLNPARAISETWIIWDHTVLLQMRDWIALGQIYTTLDEILGDTNRTSPSDPDASLPNAGKVHG